MRRIELLEIELYSQSGPLRHSDLTRDDPEWLFCQPLSVLPNPMGVDRRDAAGSGGSDLREHGQRDVEVIVGMRPPGEPKFPAQLRDADRALHGPEVRIGQRNVDRPK